MKNLLVFLAVVVAVMCLDSSAFAQHGNGAPNGPHYNLNILGKDNCPTGDFTDSNRHSIVVKLHYSATQNIASTDKTNRIYLAPGDFQVLDGNACDSGGAKFQLPAPVDGVFTYTIWARELGTPGGTGAITTCATDPTTGENVCSTDNVVLVRNTGKSSFRNVTKELTTLCGDLDNDPSTPDTCVNIFDDSLQDFFWAYDNNGLRLVQLRFYPQ